MDKHRSLIGCAVIVLSLLLDQASKQWVVMEYGLQSRFIAEILPFFNLVLVWNKGVSFGMFADAQSWMPWALTALALGITAFLAHWLRRAESVLIALALGLVIGGALGNVIDRVRFGAVLDFLDFHAYGFHWPAFNVADSSIFIGVVLLLISSIVTPENDSKTESPCDSPPL